MAHVCWGYARNISTPEDRNGPPSSKHYPDPPSSRRQVTQDLHVHLKLTSTWSSLFVQDKKVGGIFYIFLTFEQFKTLKKNYLKTLFLFWEKNGIGEESGLEKEINILLQ